MMTQARHENDHKNNGIKTNERKNDNSTTEYELIISMHLKRIMWILVHSLDRAVHFPGMQITHQTDINKKEDTERVRSWEERWRQTTLTTTRFSLQYIYFCVILNSPSTKLITRSFSIAVSTIVYFV